MVRKGPSIKMMFAVFRSVSAAAAVACLVASAAGARAQDPSGGVRIAVVDVQSVLRQSAAAKDVRTKVEKLRADHQRETREALERLKGEYEAAAKERPNLSEDAYQKRLSEIREKAARYQDLSQKRIDALDGALAGALGKIAGGIEDGVNAIIKEQKLSFVLPRSGVIGVPTVPDITQDVLKRLDRQMPTVAVDLPK